MAFGIISTATGTLVAVVESTNGVDMVGKSSVALPVGYDPNMPSHIFAGGIWTVNLAAHKSRLTKAVNDHAEIVRNRYLTPGSGQAMSYIRKEKEAREWTAGAAPGDFPFLSAEAAATGATLADMAALVLAQASAWLSAGAAIEGNRRGLIVEIEAAADTAALDTIDIEIGWPG